MTGTIGSGKSHISKLFSFFGYRLFDADKTVHELFHEDNVLKEISKISPASVKNGQVDRKILGDHVFADEKKLKKLEALLHPLVDERRKNFVKLCGRLGLPCVFEIPLYFEAGLHYPETVVVVTSAPSFLLVERSLRRPGMTVEKLEQVQAQQWPDVLKRKKADFVVHTGLSKGYSWVQVENIVKALEKR